MLALLAIGHKRGLMQRSCWQKKKNPLTNNQIHANTTISEVSTCTLSFPRRSKLRKRAKPGFINEQDLT